MQRQNLHFGNKMHFDILGEQKAVKQIVALKAMMTTNLKPQPTKSLD